MVVSSNQLRSASTLNNREKRVEDTLGVRANIGLTEAIYHRHKLLSIFESVVQEGPNGLTGMLLFA